MGGAVAIGLGLAIAQPKRPVLVLTGDGELLMGLGSLATVGVYKPANLSIVVLDNERYGETGMQNSHTAARWCESRSCRRRLRYGEELAGHADGSGRRFA